MWKHFYPPKTHQRILDVFRTLRDSTVWRKEVVECKVVMPSKLRCRGAEIYGAVYPLTNRRW